MEEVGGEVFEDLGENEVLIAEDAEEDDERSLLDKVG